MPDLNIGSCSMGQCPEGVAVSVIGLRSLNFLVKKLKKQGFVACCFTPGTRVYTSPGRLTEDNRQEPVFLEIVSPELALPCDHCTHSREASLLGEFVGDHKPLWNSAWPGWPVGRGGLCPHVGFTKSCIVAVRASPCCSPGPHWSPTELG